MIVHALLAGLYLHVLANENEGIQSVLQSSLSLRATRVGRCKTLHSRSCFSVKHSVVRY